MQQENAFLAALGATTQYSIASDRLTMRDADSSTLVVMAAAPQTPGRFSAVCRYAGRAAPDWEAESSRCSQTGRSLRPGWCSFRCLPSGVELPERRRREPPPGR